MPRAPSKEIEMRAIAAVLRELVGLFVDDDSLVLAVLLWIGAVALGVAMRLMPAGLIAIVFPLGLAIVLMENALRSARRRR
jgi:hypothetical protein